jgi:hypothetical protein
MAAPLHPDGHPFLKREGDSDYVYFASPLPLVRVPANAEALADQSRYEAYTCLVEGSRADDQQLDRDETGALRYAWRKNTPPVNQEAQQKLVRAAKAKADELLVQLTDVETGKRVQAHGGSVYWNEHRRRWVMIFLEIGGSTSFLGEVWFAEADTPLGPWVYARKIATHNKYSFYNPKQHPMYDKEGGRVIFFEGTYAHTFSGNEHPTPRYDYNQIMYKLDLADARLALPVAYYDLSRDGELAGSRIGDAHAARAAKRGAALAPQFFALDREVDGATPVYLAQESREPRRPTFFAVPADAASPPADTVPLYEFTRGDERVYSTDASVEAEGFERSRKPLCRVWRSPTTQRFAVGE